MAADANLYLIFQNVGIHQHLKQQGTIILPVLNLNH